MTASLTKMMILMMTAMMIVLMTAIMTVMMTGMTIVLMTIIGDGWRRLTPVTTLSQGNN